jgi:hypothetical protein
MSKFSELNRTYNLSKDQLDKLLISLFRSEEKIDDSYDVKISYTLGTTGGSMMRDDGYTVLTGANFIVTKLPTTGYRD